MKYSNTIDKRIKGAEKCVSCPEFPQIVDGIDYCVYATEECLDIDYSRLFYVQKEQFPRLYSLVAELRNDRFKCNDLLYYEIPVRSHGVVSIDYVLNYARKQKIKILHPELLCLTAKQLKTISVKHCCIDIYQTFLYYVEHYPDEYIYLKEHINIQL